MASASSKIQGHSFFEYLTSKKESNLWLTKLKVVCMCPIFYSFPCFQPVEGSSSSPVLVGNWRVVHWQVVRWRRAVRWRHSVVAQLPPLLVCHCNIKRKQWKLICEIFSEKLMERGYLGYFFSIRLSQTTLLSGFLICCIPTEKKCAHIASLTVQLKLYTKSKITEHEADTRWKRALISEANKAVVQLVAMKEVWAAYTESRQSDCWENVKNWRRLQVLHRAVKGGLPETHNIQTLSQTRY